MIVTKRNPRFPQRGEIFTAEEVFALPLRDCPCLCIAVSCDPEVEYDDPPIQYSHLTVEQLLSVLGFAESKWRFIKETSEWIPVFEFVGTAEEAALLVDISKEWDDVFKRYSWWVTPKGFPREYV